MQERICSGQRSRLCFARRVGGLGATAALALLAFGCMTVAEYNHKPLDPAATRGEMEAKRDLREGHLILRSFAYSPFGVIPTYQRMLYERLGVHVQIVAVGVLDGPIVTQTAAYNRVMKREIRRRFGPEVLEQIEHPAPPPASNAPSTSPAPAQPPM